MANDEIVAKIGLDASGVDGGLRTARAHLASFAESMKDVAGGARQGWKAAVKSITEQSGVAGLALKAILNPVSAALTGGVMVFKWASDHLKKWNEEMDHAQAIAAIPIDHMREAMEKASETARKYQDEWKKWLASHDHSVQAITTGLKDHIALMEHQRKLADQLLENAKARALLEGKDPKAVEAAYTQAKGINDYATMQREIEARKRADEELRRKQVGAGADVMAVKRDLEAFDMVHHLNRPGAIKTLEDRQKELDAASLTASDQIDAAAPWWMIGNRGAQSAWAKQHREAAEKAKADADRNRRLLESERAKFKSESGQLESIQDRLKKGQITFDAYGNQIEANAGALEGLGFKREETLAGMDSAQRRKLTQSQAGADFASARAYLRQIWCGL